MEKSAFYIDIQNKSNKSKKIGELYSAISHGIGALLGIAGLVLMLVKTKVNSIPIIIYGLGIIFL
ncbi:hypothetical protein [Brachyspira hyodysenteriae]|nr:hypothetical protein [Brachyspira hyodysenteriae]MCZ9948288.1 hypothetical protein [Brachyspira hyodysenteriae]